MGCGRYGRHSWECGEQDVGDAVTCGGDLDAEFWESLGLPLVFVCREVAQGESLQTCMPHFTHVAFEDLSVDVVAVRPVDGAEVFFYGDEDGGRRGMNALLESRILRVRWGGRG